MEELITTMEDSSSRIEDPIYPYKQDNHIAPFFGVFFCYEKGVVLC